MFVKPTRPSIIIHSLFHSRFQRRLPSRHTQPQAALACNLGHATHPAGRHLLDAMAPLHPDSFVACGIDFGTTYLSLVLL